MIENLSKTLIKASYACMPTFKERAEELRTYAVEASKAAETIDKEIASKLQQIDARERLVRDTRSMCWYLDIILMLSEHIKDDISHIKKAQQFYESCDVESKKRALENAKRREKYKQSSHEDNK